ncbi:DUF6491 family protein [Phenylobacterium sp. J367]|uniref:DUF6491 family protein n=1 Tax=Phenylobacterium sp. J367 TaxID=2898435 RepID=UPI0021510705|nr:DUF6491 family protein [Phenylobacterium sp. J367]MCR5878451.1 DUF6491 family protein [Phenylobacterium sp. J367]
MKRHIFWGAPIAALAFAMSAGAAPDAQTDTKATSNAAREARQCFWTRNVNGFAAADEKFVNVRVGVKDVYQFEMFGPCNDIDWSQRIAIVWRGGAQICSGFDAEIITPSPIGPQRCTVRNMKKLTPEEVAALPRRGRP